MTMNGASLSSSVPASMTLTTCSLEIFVIARA